jgi:CheY-like chemotaxis protein
MATGNGALLGVRVLLVGDDAGARDAARAALQILGGATVDAVPSAREALALIERQPPHVLVTDLVMPHEDGHWLLERIRALPRERGGLMPVIALVGSGAAQSEPDHAAARAEGFQARLSTPVEPAVLCATVARVLQGGDPRFAAA